jgi:hypothetical protein
LSLIREKKTLLIIISIVLLLVEIEIFAIAAMKSGRKSWIQIYDKTGNLVYESDGKNLSEFNKYYFEKNFGPIENYERKLVIKEDPFPFRAWFSAAIGVPIGIILLFSFVIRAYISLFYPDEEKEKKQKESVLKKTEHLSPIEQIIAYFSNLNIFIIGFLIFLAIFLYWVIPNLFVFIGKLGVDTLKEYKWIFLGVVAVFLGIFIWMIYLKYLLAKKTIESQTAIEKHRIEIEFQQAETPRQLEYNEESGPPPSIPAEDWEDADIIEPDKKRDETDTPEENSSRPSEKPASNGPDQSS